MADVDARATQLQQLELARGDPARVERWSKDLGRKGMAVNQSLTTLLGNQNARLAAIKLPHERKPGATPMERLRAFLNQISDAQKRVHGPSFGLCLRCSFPIAVPVLDEAPWVELCAGCAAAEAGVSGS